MRYKKYKWNHKNIHEIKYVSYTKSGKGVPVITLSSRRTLPTKNIFVLLCFIFSFDVSKLDEFMLPGVIKNLPAVQETRVWVLRWEDPLEKGMATHSSILAWRIPWTENLAGQSPWGCKESDTTEQLTLSCWERAGEGNSARVAQSSPSPHVHPPWMSVDVWGSQVLSGVRTFWAKGRWIRMLFTEFSLILHNDETFTLPVVLYLSFLLSAWVTMPSFDLPRHQQKICLIFQLFLLDFMSGCILIRNGFWLPSHRNHHELEILPLF